ncbi:SDR family oxidoreductase [Gluconacetobacter diazotrophicus]|uniref:SDR family oxidoreductase n=1 Tax=Gluconacetobacter diazotrophicus TaxID=33996 RepID=A0A7W4I594_GLUDI|nr:SDR family NAD(P)-dependent oxidoreductase [Gluconacetobacter diazotrophicus]MBB2154895.1 SDR family oxidoreductase [Gluconacetobacter diazotrophicus]
MVGPGPDTGSYARYPSLAGRSVLVTGGASGIGAALVRAFADQGARVAFVDLDRVAGDALAGEVAQAGRQVLFIPCDVTDVAALREAVATAFGAHGPVDILLNNAGNDARHTLDEVDVAMWERLSAINIRAQFFAAQAVAPGMRAAGRGSIVCLGSTGWMQKNAGYPIYATAKAAVLGLVNALARELGQDHIRVNALVPGWVMTERQRRLWLTPEGERQIDRSQCLPGRVEPGDIARMALFLAADDSRMCSGQQFIVDGGWV